MSKSRQNKAEIMHSLENAIWELLKEMPYADFSISELCERAGVGRSSFYRYYTSKEEVMISLLLHEWYAWRRAEGAKDFAIISHESARSFIRHVFATRELFELIHKNGLDRLFPVIVERNESMIKNKNHYIVAFFCYGVFGILRDWWTGGCRESEEDLIRVVDAFCPDLDD